MKKVTTNLVILLLSVLSLAVRAQSIITWNGSVDGSWSNANNWTPANVPDANTEVARFNTGTTLSVTVPSNLLIGGLEVINNSVITLVSDDVSDRTITITDLPSRTDLVISAGARLRVVGLNNGNHDTDLSLLLNSTTTSASVAGVLEITTADANNNSANGFMRFSTGTFEFEDGGELFMNRDEISINFSATTTFNANSTLRIEGLRSNPVLSPCNLANMSVGHLIINAADLRTNFCLLGAANTLFTVAGNLRVERTGSNNNHFMTLSNTSSGRTFNVNGNIVIGNGTGNGFMSLKSATVSGTMNLVVGGDITVNSNGTMHQHLGTANIQFGMNGGSGSSRLSGAGSFNWSVSGATTTVTINTVTPAHTAIIDRNITIGSTLTVNTGATVAFSTTNTRTLRVNGNLSGAGSINMSGGNLGHTLELLGANNAIGSFVPGVGSVQYENNTQQVIGGISYYNLDIQGGNTTTKTTHPANSNVTILNRIQLQNGIFTTGTGKVLMANNATVTRTERGSFVGPEFEVVNLGNRYNVQYNSTLTITRVLTTGPEFSSGTNVINNLSIGVGSGNYVTLNSSKTLYGTLTLSSGFIALAVNDLTIADGASFSGGSASTHIVTNGAGSLFKFGNTNGDFERTYPLGSGALYTPITVTTINRSGTGWISLRSTGHRHLTLRKASALTRYFTLNSGGGLTVNNWRGSFTNGAGEAVVGTNTVGYLANMTSINWVQSPNGASFSSNVITVPANTTQFNGAWSAGINGATNTFDFTNFEIAVNPGNWSDNATWQDGSAPAAGSNVIINAAVTLNTAINMASVSVTTAGSLSASNHALTLSGDLLVEGSWTDNNTAGNITISGDIAFAGPTTIGNQNIDLTGNLYLDFNGLTHTGTIIMRGSNARIFGSGSATLNQIQVANGANVTIVTNAMGSGLTLSGSLGNVSGNTTGRYLMGANGILTIMSATPNGITSGGDATDLTNFDFSAAGSQVRYASAAGQSVISTVYARLEIGGTGTKSMTALPNALETQVLENLNVIGNQTFSSAATGADSLIIGSRTSVNSATITFNSSSITLNVGKRTHLVIRSGGNVIPSGSGTLNIDNLWIRTTRNAPAAPANISMTTSFTQFGDTWHISNNNVTFSNNVTVTVQGGRAQSFNSQSSGVFTYGNLRIRSANTALTLNAPITVTGSSTGTNTDGSNGALTVQNASGTNLNLNGQTLTFAGANASTMVFGNNGLNMSVSGSRIEINQTAGNTCDIHSSYPSLPLGGFRVLRGNPNFITATTLNGPITVNDVTTFTGTHTISHVPSPATQRNYEGSAGVNWAGNVVISAAARLNADQNVVFTGNTFTNSSLGVANVSMHLGSGSFSMVREGTGAGNIQTIVAASGTGRLVCQNLIVDGQANRVLPEGEIHVEGNATFGPGIGPLVSTGTTGIIRIGSQLNPNTSYLYNNAMQINTADAGASTKYIFHGTGNVIRSATRLPSVTLLGEVEINSTLSSLTVSPEGSFTVSKALTHTSHNDFESVSGAIIQTGLAGQTTVISGASVGRTIMPSWWVGNGGASGISRVTRTVTVRDSIIINQGASSYLDFANGRLNLNGVYRAVANPVLRANQPSAPGTTVLSISGNRSVIGQLVFEHGYNAISQLIYNKTGNAYSLGSPIVLAGSGTKLIDLQSGTLVNTSFNNLTVDATDVTIRHAGGTTSVPFDFTNAAVADVEVLSGTQLNTLHLPAATSNSLRNLTINPGAVTVALGGVSRNVRGELNLVSGTLLVNNATLTVGGNINKSGGVIQTNNTSNLVFDGSATQTLPENLFTDATPTINHLTISNTSADGVVMTNQGMNVAGNITFTAGAGNLTTPADETKPVTLTNNGSVIGEAAGRYVIGALVSSRVATAGNILNLGVGASIMGIDAATATRLNSIGGRFTVTRLAGRPTHVTTGNPGYAMNQSIERIWKFSAVGALPKSIVLTLNWVQDDDNKCGGGCDVTRMTAFRRPNSETVWTRLRPFNSSMPYANADQGGGARSLTVSTNSFTDYTVGYFDAPLPVSWLGVQARVAEKEKSNARVVVSWKTAAELNNAYFIVERSSDLEHFDNVGRVNGAGTTNAVSSYSFNDENAPIGTVYYRIRQVDYDGKSELSPMTTVKTDGQQGRTLTLWPNPSALGDAPRVDLDDDTQANITIIDAQGKTVATYSGLLQEGRIPTQALPTTPGVYYLNVTNADINSRIKWVVR